MRGRVLEVHHGRYPEVGGGVDRVVSELLEGATETTLLFEVGRRDDRRLTRRDEDGVIVYRRRLPLGSKRLSALRKGYLMLEKALALVQLAKIIRRERIAVVHLHTLQDYQEYFVTLSRFLKCPYVVTLHRGETLSFASQPVARQRRWSAILAGAARVTSVSETLAETATKKLPISRRPAVVRNGISEPMPSGQLPTALAGAERPYAICVGALEYYKGHDVAITAWSALQRQGVEIDLYIAGDGSRREALLQQVKEQDVGERVHFLGALAHADALAAVRAASIYIMPSRSEGLAIAFLEAAALSKTIIAADIPVFREVLEHGQSGVLFPPEDAAALAESVTEVDGNPQWATELGWNAREAFLAGFSRERMVTGYGALYREILCGDQVREPVQGR